MKKRLLEGIVDVKITQSEDQDLELQESVYQIMLHYIVGPEM